MTTALVIPPTEAVEHEAHEIVQRANAITVASHADKESAVGFLRDIKTMAGKIETTLGPSRDAAHKAHKAILEAMAKLLKPLESAERNIKSKVSCWDMEQERIRREAQRKAEEEARRIAEEKRLQEAMRLEAEQKAREAEAERLRKAGEAEAAAKAQALAEAKAAQVQAALDRPVDVAPVVLPKAPTVAGASSRKVWNYRIVNEDDVPREFLIVDEKKLGKYARTMGATARVPGVEFYAEDVLAVKSW